MIGFTYIVNLFELAKTEPTRLMGGQFKLAQAEFTVLMLIYMNFPV